MDWRGGVRCRPIAYAQEAATGAGADQIRADLRVMTAWRTGMICDRVQAINRTRAMLLEYFPHWGAHLTARREKPHSHCKQASDSGGTASDRPYKAADLVEEPWLPQPCLGWLVSDQCPRRPTQHAAFLNPCRSYGHQTRRFDKSQRG